MKINNKTANPEGKIIENIASDELSKAQRVLDQCKKRDNSQKLIPVSLDNKTVFLVPQGTNIEKWKRDKINSLNKFRNSDQ